MPTDTAVPPTATQIPATLTAIPPSRTPTATATPSPTATPNFTCPQPGGNAILQKPLDFAEFSENLVTYLNAGGNIEQLSELLESMEIENEIFPVDMNNDSVLEFVLNVIVPPEESIPGDRGTAVLQCRDSSYEVMFDIWWGYYHYFDYTFSDDVNNDGNMDVIIMGGFAGSACALEPTILILSAGEILDVSPNLELSFGCSDQNRITLSDVDNDGIKEFVISGPTIEYTESPPPRIITKTFALQNSTYGLQATELGSPEVLVHVLDDAQRALDSGDWTLAIQFYEDVAQNQALPAVYSYNIAPPQMAEEWGVEPDHPQEYQKAFALFRLAALQTVLGNTAETDWALVQLQERFPEGTPGSELTSLALRLVDSLQQGNSPESSCEIVLQEIGRSYPQLAAHYYWGGNIAWYRNETICPFAAR
ncbi:MAG: hypothetical protein CL608_22380 [Anaerolineaceae bacterium]|nr:hypothetical protein [Anaerolineaceae bacterium]